MSQRRADAAVLMAESSLGRETARRIACDCTLSVNKTRNGEPIDIGRKSRIWPNAMARAIKARDQQCVWPGCDHSRHLHIHHMHHWADGGATSVDNGVCLCSHHHTLVHEGGYKIEAVAQDKDGVLKQFFQQLNHHDIYQFDFEESLRNDRESFNKMRHLSPARFRFRIIDKNGLDIANAAVTHTNSAQKIHHDSTRIDSYGTNSLDRDGSTNIDSICHSMQWQCKEPAPATYCYERELA